MAHASQAVSMPLIASRASARTTRFRGDKELIKLVSLDDTESNRCASGADDAQVFKVFMKSALEALQRAEAGELYRDDLPVRVLPGVVPDLRQVIDLSRFRRSHFHCVVPTTLSVAGRL